MASTVYAYEFDPYGTNANNKVTGERHTITAANGTDLNFFIPKNAPFHRRNFVLTNVATGLPMRPGYDYYFGYRFDQMILSGGMQPVYGAIVFNDRLFSGEVSIDYQTLGGEFTLDTNKILTLLANKQLDPRTVVWSAVVDIPTDLPPVQHRHLVDDMVGMSEVVARIYDLIDATGSGFNKTMQSLLEHIADHNNPHHITLEDLGIDDLGNLVPATKEEAETGTDNVHYMTALRVAQYCAAAVLPQLTAHENDSSNPHNVTAVQVGLGNLGNYPDANATEAAAGVATNRYMTPAATKAAIDVLAPLAMAAHVNNHNNPHQVTATQVGLGNVGNYALATVNEAITGTSNERYMTPYLVAQAVANGSAQGLAAHLLDTNNPHSVTKTQVGLGKVENYAVATSQDVLSMTATDKYLTPASLYTFLNGPVREFVKEGIGGLITKDDIGLGNVANYPIAGDEEIASGSASAYLTPAGGQTMLANLVQDIPRLVFRAEDLTAVTSAVPFTAMTGVNKENMESTAKGFQVDYDVGADFTRYVRLNSEIAVDEVTGSTYAYTVDVQRPAGAQVGLLYGNGSTADGSESYDYGVVYTANKLSLIEMNNSDGVILSKSIDVSAQAAALGNAFTFVVSQNLQSGAFSVSLKSKDGATTTATLTIAVADILAASSDMDTGDIPSLTPLFGFLAMQSADAGSNNTLFVPSRVPNAKAATGGVYGAADVYQYTGSAWAVVANAQLGIRKGFTYYNPDLGLLALSPMNGVAVVISGGNILDSNDITAENTPDGTLLHLVTTP